MSNPQPKGIDIETALSILSERTKETRDDPSHDHVGGCGCHSHGAAIPENLKTMGQTIDLNKTPASVPSATLSDDDRQKEEARIKAERAKRQEEIQKQLNLMSNKELLQAVLNAQEQRVATYRDYESGLMVVLDTGNMTSYPDACSKATASFSVLSETIKEIQSIFQSRKRTELSKSIQQLQTLEKEKLHLTAAHHLERIRERNELMAQQERVQSEKDAVADTRIQKLLQQGVASLRQKIQKTIEAINEVLDDVRCALLEEEEWTNYGSLMEGTVLALGVREL